jgi:hypothetical protein
MTATVMQITEAEVRFGECPGTGIVLDPKTLTDFSCQVTSAEIQSSANTTTTTVPATFCQPASEVSVPVASSFTLNLEFLQDWVNASGLSAWLFKNDATEKCFALYLKGADNPSAMGKIIVQAGAFGGAPGSALTATATLNIQGYPNILDSTGNPIRGAAAPTPTKGAAAPGDVFPAETTVTASDATNAAKLTALGFIATPTTAWTKGQKITIGTWDFNWSGTAWAEGAVA